MYKKIKKWYTMGLWTKAMIQKAVQKNVLTEKEAADIISGKSSGGVE